VLAINLRIPSWTTVNARVLINGKSLDVGPTPGSYMRIARRWKKGDTVTLEIPMTLRTEAFADDPSLQAVLLGPLVLAGQFPLGKLPQPPEEKPHGPNVEQSPIAVPQLPVAGKQPSEWLKPEAPLVWRTSGVGQDIVLRPLYQSQQRYAIYWKTA
jgi:uncharacterized protein